MAKAVLRNEKYMDDAFSSIMSNLRRNREKHQEETLIWGPVYMKETGSTLSENRKSELHDENSLENESLVSKRKKIVVSRRSKKFSRVLQQFDTSLESSSVRDDGNCESSDADNEDKSMSMITCHSMSGDEQNMEKSFPKQINAKVPNLEIYKSLTDILINSKQLSDAACEKVTKSTSRMTQCEQKDEKLEHTNQEAEPVLEAKNNLLLNQSKFDDWCRKRQQIFSKTSINKSDAHSSCVLKETDNKLNKPVEKHSRKISNAREQNDSKKNAPKHVSDSAALDVRKQVSSIKYKGTAVKENTKLCVKATDEKSGKSFEFISDSLTISKKKKIFPKLSALIPDVDSDSRKVNYSADAVNIILRFIFNCPLSKVMPPLATGIEVIAAAKSWEVSEVQEMFQEAMLKEVTNAEDASMVLAHASHFDLEEICEHCRSNFSVNIASNYRKRQKSCFVSVSTYIDPLEICIPFSPKEQGFTQSFDRNISNTFTFKAYSHCYILVGFRVQLNKEHISKIESHLEIDYSVRNVSKCQPVCSETVTKPLRPIIIINFKERLIINPDEAGEISVETTIKPYLCSEHKEETIKHPGEFALSMESNHRSDNSDLKLFVISGLYYHIKKKKSD